MAENFLSYHFSVVIGKIEIQQELIWNFGFDVNNSGSENKRKVKKIKGSQSLRQCKLLYYS